MTLSYKSQRYIKLNKHTHIYNGRDGEEPPQKIRKKRDEGIIKRMRKKRNIKINKKNKTSKHEINKKNKKNEKTEKNKKP